MERPRTITVTLTLVVALPKTVHPAADLSFPRKLLLLNRFRQLLQPVAVVRQKTKPRTPWQRLRVPQERQLALLGRLARRPVRARRQILQRRSRRCCIWRTRTAMLLTT